MTMKRWLCGAFLLATFFLKQESLSGDEGFIFDHSLFNRVLGSYVSDGKVNYPALKDARKDLDDYVVSLGSLSRDEYKGMKTEEKIAFLINAYNAITLQVIIDHYPIKRSGLKGLAFPPSSIRQIPGAWDKISHRVLEGDLTLDDIEHGILRKQFREPRIHMALVCAAKGCPPLRNEAYLGSRLGEQLDDQAAQFLANTGKFQIDRENRKVYLSSILKWFDEDFKSLYEARGPEFLKGKERAAVGFAASYIPSESKAFLWQEGYGIEFLDYDWSLNE